MYIIKDIINEKLLHEKNILKFLTHDNKGIFYSYYPESLDVADGTETDVNLNHTLRYHRLGTPQSEDVDVVSFPDDPLWMV